MASFGHRSGLLGVNAACLVRDCVQRCQAISDLPVFNAVRDLSTYKEVPGTSQGSEQSENIRREFAF